MLPFGEALAILLLTYCVFISVAKQGQPRGKGTPIRKKTILPETHCIRKFQLSPQKKGALVAVLAEEVPKRNGSAGPAVVADRRRRTGSQCGAAGGLFPCPFRCGGLPCRERLPANSGFLQQTESTRTKRRTQSHFIYCTECGTPVFFSALSRFSSFARAAGNGWPSLG